MATFADEENRGEFDDLTCGWALNEARLEWAEVDLNRRVIHVRRNYRNGVIGLPKSGKGREVPIVPYLAQELLSWQKKLESKTVLVCPPVRNPKRGDFYDLGLRSFATLAAKAGLNPYRLKEIMGHASIETTIPPEART